MHKTSCSRHLGFVKATWKCEQDADKKDLMLLKKYKKGIKTFNANVKVEFTIYNEFLKRAPYSYAFRQFHSSDVSRYTSDKSNKR